MRRISALSMAGLTGVLLAVSAAGQDPPLPPGYIPLFSPEQIENASPETRQRMIDTERVNREAWAKRAQERPAGSGEDPARQRAGDNEGQPAAAAPPPARSATRRKIYRWVDKNGRVNFGDTPPPTAASEVKLRGTAAPTPRAVTVGSDDVPTPGRPAGGSDTD